VNIGDKVKDKITVVLNLLNTMQLRHMGKWRYISTLLDLGTRRKCVVSFKPCCFIPGKEPRYQWDRRLGGPQSQFGRCGERNILHWRKLIPGRPVRSPSQTDLAIPVPEYREHYYFIRIGKQMHCLTWMALKRVQLKHLLSASFWFFARFTL
jgi:hypothetical protein